jgi:hypothetical protein
MEHQMKLPKISEKTTQPKSKVTKPEGDYGQKSVSLRASSSKMLGVGRGMFGRGGWFGNGGSMKNRKSSKKLSKGKFQCSKPGHYTNCKCECK